ncbi:carbonic anhydrase [Clavulina sp. PMI_390]|nr:carbonic anhydrase [Clavulina sp. PMI_390]
MSNADQFAKANESYVAGLDASRKDLPMPPARKVIVLTCMDARLHPETALGLKEGDAHVIRNAGGRSADALRSVIVSQQALGTREIFVLHHTDCGMLTFKDDGLRAAVKSKPPKPSLSSTSVSAAVDSIAFLPFSDLEQSVKDDVLFLKEHPLVLEETAISGWVFDVKDGKINKVV